MKVIIISGGYIEDAFALEWLQKHHYEMLMAADSGMDFLYRNQIVPDIIVGDFDSVRPEVAEILLKDCTYREDSGTSGNSDASNRKPEVIRLNPVKDDTDTEFAIREAIRRGATEITILGGTGSRLDHVLANMHLLGIGLTKSVDAIYSAPSVEIALVDNHNRIRMLGAGQTLRITKDEQFGDYVSILPFIGEVTGVHLEGFAYPLKDATVKPFCSLGISNEIVEEVGVISVREGALLVIESRD